MDSFELAHKKMYDEYKLDKDTLDRKKLLWETVYEMSREWSGGVIADPKLYWATFNPDGIGINRFNELMYKYFYHNPRFEIIHREGLGEESSQISIGVRDIETRATMDIDLIKDGLTSCDIKLETKKETKETITKLYFCKESVLNTDKQLKKNLNQPKPITDNKTQTKDLSYPQMGR